MILIVIIGFGIAFLSSNSTSEITITMGKYTFFNIPLFVFTVAAYLLGLIIAWIIEVPQTIATTFQIMGLGHRISSGNNAIVQLENKIKKLELENTKLHERNQSINANKQIIGNYKPSVLYNFLHKFNLRNKQVS